MDSCNASRVRLEQFLRAHGCAETWHVKTSPNKTTSTQGEEGHVVVVECGCFGFGGGAAQQKQQEQQGIKLLTHLLGVFDLLVSIGASEATCLAGGLHSIYGTSIFKTVSVPPTAEHRATIASLFGEEAERLAYLFHVSSRPQDIENGVLTNRLDADALRDVDEERKLNSSSSSSSSNNNDNSFTSAIANAASGDNSARCLPVVVPALASELYALRLIEAANLLDQAVSEQKLASKFANIAETWQSEKMRCEHLKACASKPRLNFASRNLSFSRCLKLKVYDASQPLLPGVSIEVPANFHYAIMLLDLDVLHDQLVDCIGASAATVAASRARPTFGFVLRGEQHWGMPWTPLMMLNRFLDTESMHHGLFHTSGSAIALSIDVRVMNHSPLFSDYRMLNLQARRPTSLPLDFFLGLEKPNTRAIDTLVSDMRTFGWGVLQVSPAQKEVIDAAYRSLLQLTNNLPREVKQNSINRFDKERYVGFATDYGREWLQCRNGLQRPEVLGKLVNDPQARARVATVMQSTLLLEDAATSIFKAIATHVLGYTAQEALSSLDCSTDPSSQGYKSSVHRVYKYHDNLLLHRVGGPLAAISGMHADMGLLTLSPKSTRPSLLLLQPETFLPLYPEASLAEDEWIVFAGETLALLSGGLFQAPLHSVPLAQPNPETRLPRLSMPIFLRTAPTALLKRRALVSGDVPLIDFSDTEQKQREAEDVSVQGTVTHDVVEEDTTNEARQPGTSSADISFRLQMEMTTRDYMIQHSLTLRPWRLLRARNDF